ncbi:hypothetical protein MYX76_03785 [Desulfobacterota bacterium AH_259_B03_O07]|nr:hypothetical protein [Desulfobacterota bacterium AH_259_B03_O07]
MNLKQKIIYILFVFLVSSTLGCVYLRLFQVKRQLNDFENNFRLNDESGLTLVFKNPVLLDKDVIWLMISEPLAREKKDDGELWEYILEKQYVDSKDEEENYDIPIRMFFQNDKLVEITFPKRFLENLSKPLLIKMLSSIGEANISKFDKRADSIFKGNLPSEIPKKKYVVNVLGKPYINENTQYKSRFRYLYHLKQPQNKARTDGFKMESIFTFRNNDEGLENAEFCVRGLKMSLDFQIDERND